MVETKRERELRLGRERQARFKRKHPGAGAAASRKWRKENPGYVWPARQAILDEVRLLKAEPCLDCGGSFPYMCMDFDHRDDKVENVGTMVAHGWSRARIMEEIAKCDLVCANCHRIRTCERMSDGT